MARSNLRRRITLSLVIVLFVALVGIGVYVATRILAATA